MCVFLQLILLRPHPDFTRHVRKKIAKPSAFYTFKNPQVCRSAFYRRPCRYAGTALLAVEAVPAYVHAN